MLLLSCFASVASFAGKYHVAEYLESAADAHLFHDAGPEGSKYVVVSQEEIVVEEVQELEKAQKYPVEPPDVTQGVKESAVVAVYSFGGF